MTELRTTLERATDAIASPDLASRALAEAHRRQGRRRVGVVAGAATVAVVAGVIAVQGLPTANRGEPPLQSPTAPTAKATTDAEAAPIPDAVIEPVWDPRDVMSLPIATAWTLLPRDLRPGPDVGAPGLRTSAVVDDGDSIHVLDDGERWGVLAHPEEQSIYSDTALSPDGARVVTTGRTGLWSSDLETGGPWRRVDYPPGFNVAFELPARLLPRDGTTTLLGQGDRSWLVDLVTGAAEEQPFGLDAAGIAAGDATVTLGTLRNPFRRTIDEWGPEPRQRVADALDYLQAPVVGGSLLAVTRTVSSYMDPRSAAEHDGLLVVDLGDLEARAYLPVRDEDGWYGEGGGLRALAWLDDDTLLLRVIPLGAGGQVSGTAHLVAWDVGTGELGRVSSLPADLDLSLAVDALR